MPHSWHRTRISECGCLRVTCICSHTKISIFNEPDTSNVWMMKRAGPRTDLRETYTARFWQLVRRLTAVTNCVYSQRSIYNAVCIVRPCVDQNPMINIVKWSSSLRCKSLRSITWLPSSAAKTHQTSLSAWRTVSVHWRHLQTHWWYFSSESCVLSADHCHHAPLSQRDERDVWCWSIDSCWDKKG